MLRSSSSGSGWKMQIESSPASSHARMRAVTSAGEPVSVRSLIHWSGISASTTSAPPRSIMPASSSEMP